MKLNREIFRMLGTAPVVWALGSEAADVNVVIP
jgi:hypothetical protein